MGLSFGPPPSPRSRRRERHPGSAVTVWQRSWDEEDHPVVLGLKEREAAGRPFPEDLPIPLRRIEPQHSIARLGVIERLENPVMPRMERSERRATFRMGRQGGLHPRRDKTADLAIGE